MAAAWRKDLVGFWAEFQEFGRGDSLTSAAAELLYVTLDKTLLAVSVAVFGGRSSRRTDELSAALSRDDSAVHVNERCGSGRSVHDGKRRRVVEQACVGLVAQLVRARP